jgi:F-type H+-transporting ATPase subunit alpha
MLQWLQRHRSDTYKAIESSNDLSDDQVETLRSGVAEFKDLFRQGDTGIHLHEEAAEPMDAGAQTHETVTREVRRPTRDQR